MKLTDINPREWAQNAVYAGGPFAGLSNKVEPGPAVYTEGFVPGAKIAAEHENWLHNQRTEQQRILAFDRLTDIRSFITQSANNTVLRTPLAWNTWRKCWVGIFSVSAVHYWASFDNKFQPFKLPQQVAGTAANFLTASDTAFHRFNEQTIAVGLNGAWESFSTLTAAVPATGTLAGGQLWMLPEGQGFTTRGGTAIFPSKNAAGTIVSVERWTGASFTRVALPVSVAPSDAKFFQEENGRLWLFVGYRAFYSTNDGQAWTAVATTATVPLADTMYDPVEGLWVSTAVSGGGTVVYTSPYATPGVPGAALVTYTSFSVRNTQQLGRYGIALGTLKTPAAASLVPTSEAVMVTSTYGRTWHLATTISVRPGSGAVATWDNAEGVPVGGRIAIAEDGYAAYIRRTAGSAFSQVYGCRGITQAATAINL